MLVLTRKVLESIVIGDNVTIKVLEIKGGKVRLGIEAPDGVEVHRHEVWLRLHPEQPEVGTGDSDTSKPPSTGEEAA